MEQNIAWKILPEEQKALLEKISGISFLNNFYLANDTALCLLLGHRKSSNFEFYSKEKFSSKNIVQEFIEKTKEDLKINQDDDDFFSFSIGDIKFSFSFYKHELLDEKITAINNISISSTKDIFATKIISITENATKKDFFDLYFLLQNDIKLSDTIRFLNKKYKNIKFNTLSILKSLIYFDNANLEANPELLQDTSWNNVKDYLTLETHKLIEQTFSCHTNDIIL